MTSTKQGYVYILINPSLKGLLKVGQTKKDPEERAKECEEILKKGKYENDKRN